VHPGPDGVPLPTFPVLLDLGRLGGFDGARGEVVLAGGELDPYVDGGGLAPAVSEARPSRAMGVRQPCGQAAPSLLVSTSTRLTARSRTWNSRSSTCGSNSKNATRISPAPAQPTASSWPRSTPRVARAAKPACTTRVAQACRPLKRLDLRKHLINSLCPFCTQGEPPPLGTRVPDSARSHGRVPKRAGSRMN
jgi:hypothetical protein